MVSDFCRAEFLQKVSLYFWENLKYFYVNSQYCYFLWEYEETVKSDIFATFKKIYDSSAIFIIIFIIYYNIFWTYGNTGGVAPRCLLV